MVSIPYARFITAVQRGDKMNHTQVFLAPAHVMRTFVLNTEPQIVALINYEDQPLLSG